MQHIMFEMDRGEAYSSNLRYLRQQILQGRDRGVTEPFMINMTVPDQPGLTLDVFLRLDDVYIYGIGNRESEFYFNDTPSELLFKQRPLSDGLRIKDNQRLLGFGGHYSNLGSYANLSINRGTITAALTQLARWRRDQEISNRDKETSQPTSEARHLQLLILMISEAARFPDIERTIANALDGTRDSPLTPQDIQKLTHEWGDLSSKSDLESYRKVAIRTKSR